MLEQEIRKDQWLWILGKGWIWQLSILISISISYFKKKDEHRVTYKSGGKSTQVDYVMCRRRNLKEMCDCKVILNEYVAKQHRMVVYKMVLMVKKKKADKVKPKI